MAASLTATLLASFAFFLASLPSGTLTARHLASLQSRGRVLAFEDQLHQLRPSHHCHRRGRLPPRAPRRGEAEPKARETEQQQQSPVAVVLD
ncbi:hypothetical protein E2562_003561 [Oryza meyeriana var. granulata]|uniref:Uncharacterized protein n=1 Tax=Oryza meyeriana var. granulata TaxID=110450 RepID=A0A6G1CN96_9ORYZ|nr:hypothetical protein E2562_003561 [Oryza meyeriana var. granulata]